MGRGTPSTRCGQSEDGGAIGPLTRYSFRSVWYVDAASDDAFDVVRDIGTYTAWWPEIKDVWPIDDGSVDVRARSLLPYDLRFSMRLGREDRHAGVLEVSMAGDLEGFSRFSITPTSRGSRLVFEEEVTTNKRVLNWLAPLARPAFKWNHSLMMRHGLAGLKTYLAGFNRAARS